MLELLRITRKNLYILTLFYYSYVKRIYPDTKIIGVNTFDSDSMYQSLVAGKVVTLPSAGLFSDGTSIRAIGNETFRVCQQNVDDFVLVNTDEICAAIKGILFCVIKV